MENRFLLWYSDSLLYLDRVQEIMVSVFPLTEYGLDFILYSLSTIPVRYPYHPPKEEAGGNHGDANAVFPMNEGKSVHSVQRICVDSTQQKRRQSLSRSKNNLGTVSRAGGSMDE